MQARSLFFIFGTCAVVYGLIHVLHGSFFVHFIQSDKGGVDSFSKIKHVSIWDTDCTSYLRNGLNRIVDDTFMDNLKRLCYNTSYQWKGESFDNHFLDHSINNLECLESATFLKARKPLVALASFPGSGNSWTRQLIEIVTETYTGSIYSEYQTGSKVCPASGSVFVVKTHLTNNKIIHPECKKIHEKILNFTKVIYILRNPFDAILAEFNRQTAHSLNVATKENFESTNWQTKVRKLSSRWKSITMYWMSESKLPTHVILYERQLSQTVFEMYQLMKFLDLPVKAKSLLCLSKFTVKRRQKPDWLKPSNLYDAELRSVINEAINEVAENIGTETEMGKYVKHYLML